MGIYLGRTKVDILPAPCVLGDDTNLIPSNIRKGITIAGVEGTLDIEELGGITVNELMEQSLSIGGEAARWALAKESGVGEAINKAFNIGYDALNGLQTLAEIKADSAAITAITSNLLARKSIGFAFGKPLDTVGARVIINHTTFGDIEFEVIGKDVDGEGTITLCPIEIVTERQWNSTATVIEYSASTIRTWLNNDFYNGLACASIIRKVPKVNVKRGSNSTEVTEDYCWLLSTEEITDKYTLSGKIKFYNDSPFKWWLRSVASNSTTSAMSISTSGNNDNGGISSAAGIVPCFVI